MRKPAVRLVVFLGVISIIGVIAIQVYFFQITFNNEERKLNQKIQVALWDVVEQVYEANNIPYVGVNPVYQYSSDYFVVNVNDFIDSDVLEHYLIRTFEKQNINLDFEYAIYDCQTDEMIYGKYINLNEKQEKPLTIDLPKHEEFVYYFGIYFPWRKQHILGNIDSVYYLSGILIFVILFLAYALIVILQQRRFSELQKDVVNNLTHEFKTPLSSIVLSTDVLSEKNIIEEPRRIKKYAEIVKKQANFILDQIEKVLVMTEMENVGRLNKKIVDVHDLIQKTIQDTELKIKEANGNFKLQLQAKTFSVCADEFHLTNLITNLIDNAIKYSGDDPEISISTESDKKNLYVSIADKGVGIDKKYHKKVFKKFYRIPSGNVHNVKGFGLGLSYVRSIVSRHRWKINLISKLNSGTEFKFRIPLKKNNCG
jgi:two-component system, OmpR family, phosphate regulon sensor histidine kinase PhoR